jgi:electron-transferring-flavoprotein dehydrogenase
MTRELMEYDVVVVGAGPSGLSFAIRLLQLSAKQSKPIRLCILEKGSEVGAHLLSGAVFETRALDELIPDWKSKGAPLNTAAVEDEFRLLTKKYSLRLPTPPQMHNKGNFIISLDQFCRWLAKEAEHLGAEIFPGFAATEVLYDESGKVIGLVTGDAGIDKQGNPKANFQPGLEIKAQYTVLAEGCRGSLTKIISERFNLHKDCDPQTYGIGIKELWEIAPSKHKAGKVVHTVGWPLDQKTYGGSFIYHFDKNLLSIGFVVGLDYQNPYLDPFQEFQRFKHHPSILTLLEGGRRIEYGARALNEGGWQSIPQLHFPGGLLVGCSAGFLNVPKIKGNHTAMKSGMIAAEEIFKYLGGEPAQHFSKGFGRRDGSNYENAIKTSWIGSELKAARNIRPAFRWGFLIGLAYAAIDTYLFRGKAPWTFHHHQPDNKSLKTIQEVKPIYYPKPDGKMSFDKLSSVQLSNTHHEEDQLVHLKLTNPETPIKINLALYDAPEQRYCPAHVYEIVRDKAGNNPYLQINAANCIHCKTCDIKDPTQNITWVPPEGGGGPNYSNM